MSSLLDPMNRFLNKILPWRRTIAKLKYDLAALEAKNSRLQIELQAMKQNYNELRDKHETQIKGTNVLLEFIHRTHRLNVPVLNGTIRAALQSKL